MPKPLKIGVIEDDVGCRFVYKDILERNYQVDFYDSLERFRSAYAAPSYEKPKLLVVDLRLQDGLFLDLLESDDYERFANDLSFIIVSALDDEEILKSCYSKGALDYLTKPFNRNELVVKVERAIAQILLSDAQAAAKPWEAFVDPYDMVIRRGQDSSAELTQKEYQILSLLMQAPAKKLTRSEIYERLWSAAKVSSKSLDVHLCNLRKKIEKIDLSISFKDSYFELMDQRKFRN